MTLPALAEMISRFAARAFSDRDVRPGVIDGWLAARQALLIVLPHLIVLMLLIVAYDR